MNEVIRQLYRRKSVRVFEDRPIDKSTVPANISGKHPEHTGQYP